MVRSIPRSMTFIRGGTDNRVGLLKMEEETEKEEDPFTETEV